jgi:YHS domain-containing protein
MVPKGCAICESTWGNHWVEVDGQRMFFCCEICEVEFRNMIEEVKRRTGWKTIDEIRVTGDQKGRECTALLGLQAFRYFI